MIVIIDYGMGNLWSVSNAFIRYTDEVRVSSYPRDVASADKLVLPGVGAFKNGYGELERRGLIEHIKNFIKSGKPFLGICLGMQLLFTKSYEDGEHKGLGIIDGEVVAFDKTMGLKVPHMGWNTINQNSKIKNQNLEIENQKCSLLEEVPDDAYMYFVHSYYGVPTDEKVVATRTEYGVNFCSSLCKNNIYATQFHPERSQSAGLKIIENFVKVKT
ncbi:imidazole glycerol phosphate synthase subunit HisH [Candidatus Omnitrophota bacterium]